MERIGVGGKLHRFKLNSSLNFLFLFHVSNDHPPFHRSTFQPLKAKQSTKMSLPSNANLANPNSIYSTNESTENPLGQSQKGYRFFHSGSFFVSFTFTQSRMQEQVAVAITIDT
jgi:uncharacterized Zn-finger protein